MINTQYLEEKITLSGKKKEFLAQKCGITRQSLTSKINNRSPFTVDQVAVLCRELNISRPTEKEYIFFAGKLKKTPTSKDAANETP